MRSIILALTATLLTSSAQAQSLLTSYYSMLGPADAINSRGAPLDDLCAIVQQDRANWHRFNKREQYDGKDPFFDSTERRAMMAGKCVYDSGYYVSPGQRIRSGQQSFYVYVQVFGTNGQISSIVIAEGAG